MSPTMHPTSPTVDPTYSPTADPSLHPTSPSYRPTFLPTLVPTIDPTFNPTTDPTLSPIVQIVTIGATSVTTSAISDDDISEITEFVIKEYGVVADDVTLTIDYISSGTILLSVRATTLLGDMQRAVQASLHHYLLLVDRNRRALQISSSDYSLDVLVNSNKENVEYYVSSDSFEYTEALQSELNAVHDRTLEKLIRQEDNMFDTNVTMHTTRDEFETQLQIVVDTPTVDNVSNATAQVEAILEKTGFQDITIYIAQMIPSASPSSANTTESAIQEDSDDNFLVENFMSMLPIWFALVVLVMCTCCIMFVVCCVSDEPTKEIENVEDISSSPKHFKAEIVTREDPMFPDWMTGTDDGASETPISSNWNHQLMEETEIDPEFVPPSPDDPAPMNTATYGGANINLAGFASESRIPQPQTRWDDFMAQGPAVGDTIEEDDQIFGFYDDIELQTRRHPEDDEYLQE